MQHACRRAACSCTWRARRLHVLKENLRLYDSRSTIFTKTSNVSRISNVSRTPLFAIAFFCKKPRLIIGEIRYLFFLRNKRRLLSLIEAHQEVFYRGSDEESHLDNSEESWLFVEREGSLRNVDGAALQDARDVPDDLHQETDLNVGEGDQAAVGYDVVDGNMELMSENNVLAQGILFESKEGRKWDSKIFFFFFFFCRGACNNFMCPCSMG